MALVLDFINEQTTLNDVFEYLDNHYNFTLPNPNQLQSALSEAYSLFCQIGNSDSDLELNEVHNLFINYRIDTRCALNLKQQRKSLGLDEKSLADPASVGEILQEYLGVYYKKDTSLASQYLIRGLNPNRQYSIMFNDECITIEEAIIIAKHFNTAVHFWINLDLDYKTHKLFYK